MESWLVAILMLLGTACVGAGQTSPGEAERSPVELMARQIASLAGRKDYAGLYRLLDASHTSIISEDQFIADLKAIDFQVMQAGVITGGNLGLNTEYGIVSVVIKDTGTGIAKMAPNGVRSWLVIFVQKSEGRWRLLNFPFASNLPEFFSPPHLIPGPGRRRGAAY